MMNGTRELVTAAIKEPTAIAPAQIINIGLGPCMSPRRPNTGVATAAVSRVTVIVHDALDGLVCNSIGSSGMSGIISVCVNDTLMPAAAKTAIRTPGCAARTE